LAACGLVENVAKFVQQIGAHVGQQARGGGLFLHGEFFHYFSLTMWTKLCLVWNFLFGNSSRS
jgi:hypothetical protein